MRHSSQLFVAETEFLLRSVTFTEVFFQTSFSKVSLSIFQELLVNINWNSNCWEFVDVIVILNAFSIEVVCYV